MLFPAALAAAVAPIVVAAVRAVDRGWLPVTDNALITIRARDVLTDHHPLLGTWSSASALAGVNYNNPGPLFFDVLALPAKLVEGGAGVVFAVAALNVASVVGIGVFARRRGGDLAGVAALAVAAGLMWAMGSEVLYEPWQPHGLLLPFLCFIVLAWSVACGDLPALPLAVVVGSLVLQTHLSYGLLVPAIGATAALGFLLHLREQRRGAAGDWPRVRRRAGRGVVVAGVLLALCWAQSFVEQLTAEGRGNISRLAAGSDIPYGDMVGVGQAARLVSAVVALPPWWFRPSFSETLPAGAYGGELPSAALAWASLGAVALVLAGCWGLARRRRDRTSRWAALLAAVALLAGLLSAVRAPASDFGIAPHQFRWIWPLGAFVALAVALALAGALVSRPRRWAVPVLAVATIALALVNLPTSNQSPTQEEWAIPSVKALNADLADLDGSGTVLVRIEERFGDPYGSGLLAELQRRDVEFVVDDPILVRQLGPERAFNGGNADAQLVLKVGDDVFDEPPRSRRIAMIQGLDRREQRERGRLEDSILEQLTTEGLPLLEEGARRLGRADRSPDRLRADPRRLLESGELVALYRAGFLDLDDDERRRIERYAQLTDRWDDQTAAVFLLPDTEAGGGR